MSEQVPILQVKKLVKTYGDKPVLNGIDLVVEKGKVIAILGPSGCGKSTFLRCLNGLEEVQGGDILLESESLISKSTDWRNVRQRIGMVFQSYDLFPNLTVMENILLSPLKVQKRPRQEVEAQARELLERVGLADRANDYPRQLSGGQKQRIAIVRALCINPDIMLFDEVTASLDPEMVREVLDVIAQLADQGMTMLIVTHEMNFARLVADEVIFMDKGNIHEHAPAERFFSDPQTERAQQFLNILQF
ncbi:amino acid ABC transporter ATP-binding protein [Ureibacillus sinduriensis]|uniref:Glutamine ABC transporter ATP-binding protein n=1 Tax=Ureibacillus sinduriensis BLB-1 = JCM 15800 TaxID=1384057 RepID=A0A0A3I5X2_9BACL|nr:amino acid ABC transporter ATP-binding protein [Ureibacillus sinduriensis]KGR78103.1 glutamine ABC transporter ATP-binding protein [Ureibacillus sinduriensis BLB-1 = JCM 15800]